MTRQTKRAQVEALGWKLTAVPRHFSAGTMWRIPDEGQESAAFDDYKHPEAWWVTPPPGRELAPRRFEGSSPNAGVRWAYEQAMAPEPPPAIGGVAGLALMMSAGKSGVVMEGGVESSSPARPDVELLSLCREIAGCSRIADRDFGLNPNPSPWDQPVAFKAWNDRTREARREREQLISRALDLEATTAAGLLAKSRVVLEVFATTCSGRKKAAVQGLVEDLARVLG